MEEYESVIIELVLFDSGDVITASGGEGDIPLDPAARFGSEDE